MKVYDRDYVTLAEVLATAQLERADRMDFVEGTHECGWVTYEREVMLDAVNELRAGRGWPPIDVNLLRVAEQRAVGHSDYTKKFALGAEELSSVEHPPAVTRS